MSRIGRKPVAIPSGVTLTMSDALVTVAGTKGTLTYTLLPEVALQIDDATATVTRVVESPRGRAMHGLTRQILANMIQGVSQGFEKKIEIIGVGYKAAVKGNVLNLSLGFSHPVDHPIPDGIEIIQDEKNKNLLTIRGIDKQLVGQVAADIRSYRPPEPYKGKGVRYVGENVRRKPGKAAAKSS